MNPDNPAALASHLCKDFCEDLRGKERPGLQCDGTEARYVSRNAQYEHWTSDKINELLRVSGITADWKTIRQRYVQVFSTLVSIQATSHIPFLQYLSDLITYQRNDASLPWRDPFRGFDNEDHFHLFRKHQWRFCPVSIDCDETMVDRLLDRCEILPLSRLNSDSEPKFRVKPTPHRESTLTAFEVNYEGESHRYPQGQGHTSQQIIRYLVFKTFRNRLSFNDERKAYHAFKKHKNIVDFYGSFHWYSESGDRHSTIILDLAEDGSLLDLYKRNEPPTTSEGIHKFWMLFIGLVEGVMALHNHDYEPGYTVSVKENTFSPFHILRARQRLTLTMHVRIHQDLKPSNVLVFPNQPRSPHSVELKIGDLGASTVKYGSQHQRNSAPDTGSGKTYGPPELHLGGRMNMKVGLHVDIWAIACILLEAAVWVSFGEAERLAFRDRRINETSKLSDEHWNIGCSDTFHDGSEPLKCVQDVLEKIRDDGRRCDTLTPEIVDYILRDCLVYFGIRHTVLQVRSKLGQILQHRPIATSPYENQRISWQTTTHVNPIPDEGRLGNGMGQGAQAQPRPDLRPGTFFSVSGDSPAKQMSKPSTEPTLPTCASLTAKPPLQIRTTAPQSEYSGNTPKQQSNGISPGLSASPVRSQDPSIHSGARSPLQGSSSPSRVKHTSHPEVTPSELHKWILEHKKSAAGDLPGWKAIQDSLAGRDFIIIVDNSILMLKHREELLTLVKDLSYLMKQMDPNGFEVVFTSSPSNKHKCKTSTAVEDLLKGAFGPGNSSYCRMEHTINEVLKDVKRKFEKSGEAKQSRLKFTAKKPSAVSIYVFTNGIWDNSKLGTCNVDKSIENLIGCMKQNGVLRTSAAIQFVRFGSSEIGIQRLTELDDDLPKRAQNQDYDIVDHKASTDSVWEILEGPVSGYNDSLS
ncbi:uncharacterized protein PG998_000130 [Apiospora kogelbergensis]|uniref:uncharacterized protein n=1 Tax=Apiospora kogelbergensis TaxID=1337665 RepID=UPI003130F27B